MHKITIRQKKEAEGRPMTGASCEVLIDDKPMKGVTAAKFSVDAKSVARLELEMLGNFEIEGNFSEEQIDLKGVGNEPEESQETEETTGNVETELQES